MPLLPEPPGGHGSHHVLPMSSRARLPFAVPHPVAAFSEKSEHLPCVPRLAKGEADLTVSPLESLQVMIPSLPKGAEEKQMGVHMCPRHVTHAERPSEDLFVDDFLGSILPGVEASESVPWTN